ncbi:GntR family transcriptional regulator [Bombilactobacillus bombi]|uniref:GntR family transcriptional regulator n=1 Tax=Bombilactobacillus bombi TaxID=1303590 RepID=UPI001C6338B8|nr:GntR family transcriptional regulator [Bombilactobacillus bombi]
MKTQKLKHHTKNTLYEQLANTIRKNIQDNIYKRGEQIPSEMEFHKTTGLSRSTIRKALNILTEEGLLTKVHGKGTFVSKTQRIEQNKSSFLSFTDNVERMGKTMTTKMVNAQITTSNKEQENFFNLPHQQKLIKITRIRYIDLNPICVETIWFTQLYKSLLHENLNGSLYSLLKNKYNVLPTIGKKVFGMSYADQNEASFLNVPSGSALMLIENYVNDSNNRPLHITYQVIRGDKFKYAVTE